MFGLVPFESTGNSIFNYFDNMEKNLFGNLYSSSPNFRTDIIDKGDRFILTADMPGYEKEDISIDVSDDMLTIKAEKNEENTHEDDEKHEYVRKERRMGMLCRSFNVANIDTDEIMAEYRNGVLELTLPKKAPEKPESKKITVQ